MPTLTIHRAEPFIRGDQSISIWVDEKSIGILPTTGSLVKEIPEGTHQLQAWMNGSSGKKISISAWGGEDIAVTLSNTRMARGGGWDIAVLAMLFVTPDQILPGWGVWIKAGLFILLISWSIFDLSRRRRGFLKLEMAETIEAQSG